MSKWTAVVLPMLALPTLIVSLSLTSPAEAASSLASSRATSSACNITQTKSLAVSLSKGTLIGSTTFYLKPLASIVAKIKLTAAGRKLLTKQKKLNATLTITTHAQPKATKTVVRHLVIKAKS